MAQLFVAAAINIAVGLALNALFPPPDVTQEGPRLSELGYTSAAYGKFVNIPFGTDRMDGNIIDATDPAIEEQVKKDHQGGKKGGKGGSVTVKTYSYFFTGRLAFCIEGADDIIRLWADGKIIYDTTNTSQLTKDGVSLTFYPGGEDQAQDPEEVIRRGADTPAYKHLTTIKFDRLPLADYGNRIPNFTAEISFNTSTATPFTFMDEPGAGVAIPGGVASYFDLHPETNALYSLEHGSGHWCARASDLTYDHEVGSFSNADPAAGRDGYSYCGDDSGSNSGAVVKRDLETGEEIERFGTPGIGTTDTATRFWNAGTWHQLQITDVLLGVSKSVVLHINDDNGSSNGALIDPDLMSLPAGFTTPVAHIFSTSDGLPANAFEGTCIPDHDRGRFFLWIDNNADSMYELWLVEPTLIIGTEDVYCIGATITLIRQFSRGTFGTDDFGGTNNPSGWAVNRVNGDLILSNADETGSSGSVILYNPDDDIILATLNNSDFVGRNNYYSGTLMAWADDGVITVVDTRTLEVLSTIGLTALFSGVSGDGTIHEPGVIWDDRQSALIFSRSGSGASVDERIVKVYVNRLTGNGVGLDTVVTALSTSYQRQTMAGLAVADIDVSELTSDTVEGYTLTRKSDMRSALEPLRARFDFDAIQSDWIMKFPKRGQSSLVTVPEEYIGELKRGRDINDEPAVVESRASEISLPMRLNVRYKNLEAQYAPDVEHDKRQLSPTPLMRSKDEATVDIPLVDVPTNMKQVAQKKLWTLWNERVTYKTVIPWTYINLDPTDVFSLGVFGETAQVRMLENDFGAGWAIEITTVVEDTAQYSSTVAGGTTAGNITKGIPSNLPTLALPMDAPILDNSDFVLAATSNAYITTIIYDDGWPGAVVQVSEDGGIYLTTGSVNVSATYAKVLVPAGAWNYNDSVSGDYPNRIQEVADGGTMTISALRDPDFWASCTEEQMLSMYNTVAIIKADGTVEILSFVDVTDNGDGTFTLDRLLRGRLGTEDIADVDMLVGAKVVGLVDSAGNKQTDPIMRQNLGLADLNVSRFFRAATVGTQPESAPNVSYTYTGRDLKPYSITQIAAADDGSGGKDITWARRARGFLAAEWLDDTGEVPLNETIEEYVARLYDDSHTLIQEKADLTTESVNFSAAELFAANPPATVEVAQVSASGLESPITPSSIVEVSEAGLMAFLGSTAASEGSGSTVTTYGLALPVLVSDLQENDFIVAGVFMSRPVDGSPGTVTSDSGDFTEIANRNQDVFAIDAGVFSSLWYRVATAADAAAGTPTFNWSWSNGTFPSIAYMVFRFVDVGGTPVETGTTAGSDNDTSLNLGSLTAGEINTFGIYCWATRADTESGTANNTPNAEPSGFIRAESARDGSGTPGDSRHRYGLGYKRFTDGGPLGTQIFSWSGGAPSANIVTAIWTIMNPE